MEHQRQNRSESARLIGPVNPSQPQPWNDAYTNSTDKSASKSKGAPSSFTESRRLFLKSSVAASALISSLASRSAFAQQCTPSAALSGNLSGRHVDCQAFDAEFWIHAASTSPEIWPDGNGPDSSFSALFGVPPLVGETMLGMPGLRSPKSKASGQSLLAPSRETYFLGNHDFSLLDVLQRSPHMRPGGSPSALAQRVVVTYLNASFFNRPEVNYTFYRGILPEQVVEMVVDRLRENSVESNTVLYEWLSTIDREQVVPTPPLG